MLTFKGLLTSVVGTISIHEKVSSADIKSFRSLLSYKSDWIDSCKLEANGLTKKEALLNLEITIQSYIEVLGQALLKVKSEALQIKN